MFTVVDVKYLWYYVGKEQHQPESDGITHLVVQQWREKSLNMCINDNRWWVKLYHAARVSDALVGASTRNRIGLRRLIYYDIYEFCVRNRQLIVWWRKTVTYSWKRISLSMSNVKGELFPNIFPKLFCGIPAKNKQRKYSDSKFLSLSLHFKLFRLGTNK